MVKNNWKSISNLEYYYILDEDKQVDKKKRIDILNFTKDFTISFYFIALFNIAAIYWLMINFFGIKNWIYNLFLIITINLFFILFFSHVAKFIFKHTTSMYILIPLISLIVYLFLYDYFDHYDTWLKILIYLLITFFLYSITVLIYPLHILRQISAWSILLSFFVTILSTLSVYLFSNYFEWIIENEGLLFTSLDTIPINDETVNSFILNYIGIIMIIRDLIKNEVMNELNSYVTLFSTLATISYSFGGTIILIRLSSNKKRAKNIYRNSLLQSKYDYDCLVKCAYLGGEEYENLILNNGETRKIIIETEKDLIMVDENT